MNKLSCKCGCSKFNVPSGGKPWWEHVLTCRKCGNGYHLPVLYVDDILYNGYNSPDDKLEKKVAK